MPCSARRRCSALARVDLPAPDKPVIQITAPRGSLMMFAPCPHRRAEPHRQNSLARTPSADASCGPSPSNSGCSKSAARLPAPHRRLVDRLTHLGRTCGVHLPGRLVERETTFVPVESAMREHPPHVGFEIVDQAFVFDFDHHALGQHAVPVRHQRIVCTIVAAEFAEVITERHVMKDPRENRQTGLQRRAAAMNEARVRQRQVNQPDVDEIERIFVGEMRIARCSAAVFALNVGQRPMHETQIVAA